MLRRAFIHCFSRSFSFAVAAMILASGFAAQAARGQSAPASAPSPLPAGNSAAMFSDAARTAAQSDPVLQGMMAEIERSKAQLRMDGVHAPYFIEYRVTDMDDDSIDTIFGATQLDQRSRVRILRVTVRVGDYKQDSYFRGGMGAADIAPYENDVLALREKLWEATDRAYKAAGEAYAAKQSLSKQVALDSAINDFAPAPALVDVQPLVALEVNIPLWRKTAEEASGLYRKYPEVQSVQTTLRFTAVNDYTMNTEGTVARRGYSTYTLATIASAQAPDGLTLERSPFTMVRDPTELPPPDRFVADAEAALKSLQQLRVAPLVDEDYRGPVLFNADAAVDVLSDLVGGSVLGAKPEPGATARTVGDYASSYKSRVMPDFITIVDDPTQTSYDGQSMIGSYSFDDEGVKAEAVTVIDKGVLANFLIGREPIRDFPASNGHGRAVPGAPAAPNYGNLFLRSTKAMPLADLKKKLIDMCQVEGKPYGYFVETLGEELSPRLLYRIWAKDGHEELVRGAVFNELDTRELRNNLIATGDKNEVRNREGNIPQTVIAPALLFDDLEVKRADTANETPPEYPPPPFAPASR
jgi:TldD protein